MKYDARTFAEDSLCRSLLGQINIRGLDAQRELTEAIKGKQWSKVAGWDGIDIGLMMAEKTIKDEMRQNAPSPATGPAASVGRKKSEQRK